VQLWKEDIITSVFIYSHEQAFFFNEVEQTGFLRVEMADEHLSSVLHTPTSALTLNIEKLSAIVSSTVSHINQ
jgi:hypothetical protein